LQDKGAKSKSQKIVLFGKTGDYISSPGFANDLRSGKRKKLCAIAACGTGAQQSAPPEKAVFGFVLRSAVSHSAFLSGRTLAYRKFITSNLGSVISSMA
jgi:hypothetical protein